MTGLVFKF